MGVSWVAFSALVALSLTQDGWRDLLWPMLAAWVSSVGWLVWAVMLRRRLTAAWQRAEQGTPTRSERATVLPWVSIKNGPRQRAAQMADGTLIALFFADKAAGERLGEGEITVQFFGAGKRASGPASVRTAAGEELWLASAFVGAERSSYR